MGNRIIDICAVILLSSVIGIVSLMSFIYGLIKHGPSQYLTIKRRNERPEVLCNDVYGRHNWVALKNSRLKLHYVASGSKDKPLMVFLHGFPEFWYSWRHQLKEFSKDYRAVAVDLRGYGDSDKPRGVFQYTIDKLTNDVDQLIESLGYQKCILVGHDWGGAVAWYFAATRPGKVEKLVICNSPHPIAFHKHIRSSFTQLTKSWYMFFFLVPVLPILTLRVLDLRFIAAAFCGKSMGAKQGTFTTEDMEAYKYTFSEYTDLCGPINYYRASLVQGLQWPKSKLISPTLMIWGTKDGALDKKLADLSGNYVESFTLQYIDGASHWVQQEEPEQTNSLIRQFLST